MTTLITEIKIHDKVINIPIFENKGDVIDFGMLYAGFYDVNKVVTDLYTPLTVEEMLEVSKMLTGNMDRTLVNYPPTGLNTNLPTDEITDYGFISAPIFIWKKSDGTYVYYTPFANNIPDGLSYRLRYRPTYSFDNAQYFLSGDFPSGRNISNISWADRDTNYPHHPTSTVGNYLIDCISKQSTIECEGGAVHYYSAPVDMAGVSSDIIKQNIDYYLANYDGDPEDMPSVTERDPDNPYGNTDDGTSGPGGGDGDGDLGESDPVDVPTLPVISACNSGFITIYNPSITQLKQLSQYLWSTSFDVEQLQKLFADPMEGVIGLSIVPVQPSLAGAIPVMIGNATTPVSMQMCASQFATKDCGTVTIEPFVKSFLDYDPYTKVSIYLPYVGLHHLSADDVMGEPLHVIYHVDIVTGGLSAMIKVGKKGVLYQFNGNCATNVPITATNFSGAIQNAISTIVSAGTMAAGVASGAAPLTAMGAMGLVNSAANTACNSKLHVQRSGNMGGSAGLLSVQKPYVIIQRPRLSVPNQINTFVGNTSNMTVSLGGCSGFTMVEYIHLHGISATSEELNEIESKLKQGVIL